MEMSLFLCKTERRVILPCQPKKFLDLHKICLLSDWATQSPNLNVIENVWQILKSNVHKHFLTKQDDLWKIVKYEWDNIPRDSIINPYESILKRLDAVILSKGQLTKY